MPKPAIAAPPVEPQEEAVVLVLRGEYDVAVKDQVRAAFDSLAEAPTAVVDFSDVTYIDCSVIRELIRLHNTRAAGGLQRETVVARSASLLRVFHMFHLEAVFPIVEALDDALGNNGDRVRMQYASSFA